MAKKAEEAETIVAVKGFGPDLSCLGHKFEVGHTYKASGEIKACENGFHACENPLDVWSYYPIVSDSGKLNRWAVVEMGGKISRHDDDSKIASAEITIKAELSLPEFIGKAVSFIIDYTKLAVAAKDGKETLNDKGEAHAQIGSSGHCARIGSSGGYAQIGSSGYSAQIGSSGGYAQIGSSGYSAQIGSSGGYAQIGSSGYSARIGSSGGYAQIGSSGYSAQIGSSGHSARIGSSGGYARIGSSGHSARIGSSGHSARIGSSGHSAQIVSEGKEAVIASAGKATQASGKDGAWISLAEYGANDKCVGFATGCIGRGGLKPDVMYRAQGGKLVEV